MLISKSTVSTDRASRYLQQLCKHFGHKIPVTFTPEKGEITFSFGICNLIATSAELMLSVHASGKNAETDLEKLENVIADHLVRFAFRENLEMQWERTQ